MINMETKFNFKSQICTTREQSERLLSLGLKKETADATWYDSSFYGWTIMPIVDGEDIVFSKRHIPAWSLHRLIEMMGANNIQHWLGLNVERDFDLIIDTIEELIKEGYFNKEYLNGVGQETD